MKALSVMALSFCVLSQVVASEFTGIGSGTPLVAPIENAEVGAASIKSNSNTIKREVVGSGGEVDPNAEVGAASVKSNSNTIKREVVESGGEIDPKSLVGRNCCRTTTTDRYGHQITVEHCPCPTRSMRPGVDLAGARFVAQNPQGLSDAAMLEKIKLGSFDSLDFSSSENPISTSEDGLEPAEVQRRKSTSNVGSNY